MIHETENAIWPFVENFITPGLDHHNSLLKVCITHTLNPEEQTVKQRKGKEHKHCKLLHASSGQTHSCYFLKQSCCVMHTVFRKLSLSCQQGASIIAQMVENPPAMQETLVRFLGREDPLEKG